MTIWVETRTITLVMVLLAKPAMGISCIAHFEGGEVTSPVVSVLGCLEIAQCWNLDCLGVLLGWL